MKARIKATGKIVEVKYSRQMGPDAVYRDLVTGEHYMDFELAFLPEDGAPDYWTRLEHQYAGMAMQGILSGNSIMERIAKLKVENLPSLVAKLSIKCAHALVEKLKEREEK